MQDDPEYFDPPGGLLSLDLHLGDLLEPAQHLDLDTSSPIQLENFKPHFNLVNVQLAQVSVSPQAVCTPPEASIP